MTPRLQRAWAAWRRFWFRPVNARSLGVMRLGLGIILFFSHLAFWPDLDALFGRDAVTALEPGLPHPWPPSYWLGEMDPGQLRAYHLAGAGVMLALAAGWQSRITMVLAFLLQITYLHRNPNCFHGGDQVLRLMTFYLCFVPTGAAVSVDAWLARRRRERRGDTAPRSALVPIFGHRLVQVQLALVYFITGVQKLETAAWRDGTALYYALSSGTFERVRGLSEPLLTSGWGQALLAGSTWLTLAWELLFPLLVLWRRPRALALVAGVLVHVGIAATMMVGSFSFAMMWGYLAFLDPNNSRLWRERPALRGGAERDTLAPQEPPSMSASR